MIKTRAITHSDFCQRRQIQTGRYEEEIGNGREGRDEQGQFQVFKLSQDIHRPRGKYTRQLFATRENILCALLLMLLALALGVVGGSIVRHGNG